MHCLYSALIFMCLFRTIRAFKARIPRAALAAQTFPLPCYRKPNPELRFVEPVLLKCVLGMALWFREVSCRYISLIALLRTFILEENSSLFKGNKEGASCVKLSLYSLLRLLSFLLSSEVSLKEIKFRIWNAWVHYGLNWEVSLFKEVFSFIHILQLRAISIMS